MCFDFLDGISGSTYKWYVHAGKVTRRHARIRDVVKELNKVFPSSQGLRMTAQDDVVFIEYDEETLLPLVHSGNAFIRNKMLFSTPLPHISLLFRYYMRYEEGKTASKASRGGPVTSFFDHTPSHEVIDALHWHHSFHHVASFQT